MTVWPKAGALLAKLKAHPFSVFGTGYVGERFYEALSMHNLAGKVSSFVVSEAVGNARFHGVKVCDLAEYAQNAAADSYLCIAVHPGGAQEVIRRVQEAISSPQHGPEPLLIHPYLYALLLGDARKEKEMVSTQWLLEKQQPEEHRFALRFAATAHALWPEDPAWEQADALYEKLMSLHAGRDTARRRLQQLKLLVQDIKVKGYAPESLLVIDETGQLLDGYHRLSAACALGIKTLPCMVFPGGKGIERLRRPENLLSTKTLESLHLLEEEWDILRRAFLRASRFMPGEETAGGEKGHVAKPDISVILPVFNVGHYLDVCMLSILRQSFRNMEILLIDDGSEQETAALCRTWAKQDGRIRLLVTSNQGVSAARNLGIRTARGTYLAFIDPDDWVEPDYLRKLFDAARKGDADFAECDFWRYDDRSGRKLLRICSGQTGEDYTREERMKYAPTASYKSISRKALWDQFKLRFPNCPFESPAIYPLLIFLSDQVVSVKAPLYYYRRYRPHSLVEEYAANAETYPGVGTLAMQHLLEGFARCRCLAQCRQLLKGIVIWRLNDILALSWHRRNEQQFALLAEECRHFVRSVFGGREQQDAATPYILWGSYNLARITMHMERLHDPSLRFGFSAMAAALSAREHPKEPVHHKNTYREQMINRERMGVLWEKLRKERPALMIMDFLEERFPLCRQDDGWVTLSDAYLQAMGGHEKAAGEACSQMDAATFPLWKEQCRAFFQQVRRCRPGIRIILVETLLCETHGTKGQYTPYKNLDEIRRINAFLKECYRFAKREIPGLICIPLPENLICFTDDAYEYGVLPEHMNARGNRRIAQLIDQRIEI